MIPGLGGEIRADVSAALHAKRNFIAPGIAQNVGNQRGGSRQRFRWFHTHTIAGGNGINRGQQRQLHRVIPRRHDTDHAFGDEFLPRAGGPEGIGHSHAARAHPMPQITPRITRRIRDQQHIRKQGFYRRAAFIFGIQHRHNLMRPRHHSACEARQQGAALLEIRRTIPRFSGAERSKGFGRGHRGKSFTAASPESTAASMVAGRRGQVQSPASTRLR